MNKLVAIPNLPTLKEFHCGATSGFFITIGNPLRYIYVFQACKNAIYSK